MTEHEKLKEICDEIGYKIKKYNYSYTYGYYRWVERNDEDGQSVTEESIDVREIIFTTEFWYDLQPYLDSEDKSNGRTEIMQNLNNPVDYLHKLIFNK